MPDRAGRARLGRLFAPHQDIWQADVRGRSGQRRCIVVAEGDGGAGKAMLTAARAGVAIGALFLYAA